MFLEHYWLRTQEQIISITQIGIILSVPKNKHKRHRDEDEGFSEAVQNLNQNENYFTFVDFLPACCRRLNFSFLYLDNAEGPDVSLPPVSISPKLWNVEK